MLFIVPTPIGNLGDITLRAIEVLRTVDVIACEDTRHSIHLLRHHGIQKPLVSYHEHNEARRTAELIEQLAVGKTVAVINCCARARPAACRTPSCPAQAPFSPGSSAPVLKRKSFFTVAFCR
jgi:hypothetical protein